MGGNREPLSINSLFDEELPKRIGAIERELSAGSRGLAYPVYPAIVSKNLIMLFLPWDYS